MNAKNNSMLKYLGASMAVGGTVMLGSAMLSTGGSVKKKMKKTAAKALDVLDNTLTSVQNMIK